MTYRQWRKQVVQDTPGFGGAFWDIIDFNWTPAEQNVLARAWKNWRVT